MRYIAATTFDKRLRAEKSINGTEMAVARSSDGGRTWTPTYFALQTGQAQFNDKPMIAVDTNPNSPYRDTIYVAWDNATGGNGKTSSSNGVLVSHSIDGGRTFSAPVYATDASGGPKSVIAADPFVAPDGALYVAWNDLQNSRIAVSRSVDGGQSFGPVSTIAPTQATYEVAVPAMSVRQALIYPACGVDAGSGPRRGTLYCSWMDETGVSGTDIFVARAQAPGTSWSQPVRANDDPSSVANDQFNQWLAVDPTDGSIDLGWNDTRNDPSHLSTDIYFGRSTDGAATFAPNVRVTTAPTDETCCGAELYDQYGDYEGIAALGGTIRPVWTDRRASVVSLDEEVFTATLSAKPGR